MTGLVILNYNASEQAVELVKAVGAYGEFDLIAVVDNASTDDSVQRLQGIGTGKVHVLLSQTNGGYSAGNNIGLRWLAEQGCDVIFLANPDVRFSPQAVSVVAQKLRDHPNYGAMTCQMENVDGSLTPVLGLYRPSFCDQLLRELVSETRMNEKHLRWIALGDETIYPQAAIWGCFLAFSADALRKISFLDEGVFLYREEQVLGYQMDLAGLQLGITGAVSFVHQHDYRAETRAKRVWCVRQAHKSDMYMWKKYRGIARWQQAILWCVQKISLGLRMISYVLRGVK